MRSEAVSAPILIVEDNEETRDVLERILTIRGYGTVTAGDGLDALSYLRGGGDASLIVLDMRMPNMDGWAFRRALQADRRFATIPIVIYTADSSTAQDLDGVAGYIRKGATDPDALLALIEKAAQPARTT